MALWQNLYANVTHTVHSYDVRREQSTLQRSNQVSWIERSCSYPNHKIISEIVNSILTFPTTTIYEFNVPDWKLHSAHCCRSAHTLKEVTAKFPRVRQSHFSTCATAVYSKVLVQGWTIGVLVNIIDVHNCNSLGDRQCQQDVDMNDTHADDSQHQANFKTSVPVTVKQKT